MKKTTLLGIFLSVALTYPTMGQSTAGNIHSSAQMSLKQFMMVGPYAGYAFGFGNRFKDYEASADRFTAKTNVDAGFDFGGSFYYGVTDKIMLGGELMFQQYKVTTESNFDIPQLSQTGTPGSHFANKISLAQATQAKESNSDLKISFLASGLYALSYMRASMLLLNAGIGLYDHGVTDLGFFGGVMYQRLMTETMSLFVLPRLHIVFADQSMYMLQVLVGLHFWLGQTGAPMSK